MISGMSDFSTEGCMRALVFTLSLMASQAANAGVIPLDTYSGLVPQLECDIQGVRGLCAVDFGAEATFISGKAAKGLKVLTEQSMQTLGGIETYPVVEVKSLKLGPEQVAFNIKALVQDKIPTTSGEVLIGTIGVDIFLDKTIVIDNTKSLSAVTALYINPAQEFLSSFKQKGKMLKAKRPIIEVKLGGKAVKALIDTHASSAVTGTFVKNNPELFKLLGRQQKTDIAGFTKSYMMAEPTEQICILNQCTKSQWPYMVIPPQENIDIILGVDYVQQYTWLLSPKTSTFSVLPKKKQ